MECKSCGAPTPLLFMSYADYCDDCLGLSEEERTDETTKPMFEDWWATLRVGSKFNYRGVDLEIVEFDGLLPIASSDGTTAAIEIDRDRTEQCYEFVTPILDAQDRSAVVAMGTHSSTRQQRIPSIQQEYALTVEQAFAPLNAALDELLQRIHQRPVEALPEALDKPSQRCYPEFCVGRSRCRTPGCGCKQQ